MNTLPNPFALFNKKPEPEKEKEKEKETVIEGVDGTTSSAKNSNIKFIVIPLVLIACFIIMALGYSIVDYMVISSITTSTPTSTLRVGFATLAVVLWGVFVSLNLISDPTQTLNIFRRSSLSFIVVIATFFVLETPIGQYLINKMGNRFGLMVVPFFDEFGRLVTEFKSACFPNPLDATHVFPMEYILPVFDLNNGFFKYENDTSKVKGLFIDREKFKDLFKDYKVYLDIALPGTPGTPDQAKRNVSDLFKLCLYKYSAGHFIIVFTSLVSATLGASIIF